MGICACMSMCMTLQGGGEEESMGTLRADGHESRVSMNSWMCERQGGLSVWIVGNPG